MALKFDIKNVICINLKSLNEQQIFSISENYFLGFESLIAIKNDDFEKIWVEVSGDFLIAYTRTEDPDVMVVSPTYCPISKRERTQLSRIQPIKTPRIPNNLNCLKNYEFFLSKGYKIRTKSLENKLLLLHNSKPEPVQYDVDELLDKISACGIKSLTTDELNFLNEYSNKIK